MLRDPGFWTAVAAVAASTSALLAAVYTWLTYRLVKGQTEPNVVTYVRHDESRRSVLQIVIENNGRGLATDVTFTSSRPIPAKAWGLTPESTSPATTMTHGPLIEGILALGPGDTRKISWGQYHGLKAALGDDDVIELVCLYKGRRRRTYRTASRLDVRSFAATDSVPSEGARVVTELERIAKATETVARWTANEEGNMSCSDSRPTRRSARWRLWRRGR
jgi:hypothetical protein